MTVKVMIGRRVPQNWFKRQANKFKGLLSFQENIWHMVKQSLDLAKRKAKADGRLVWETSTEYEKEEGDIHWQLEWYITQIQGTKAQEEEEYKESMQLYDKLGKHFKKDFPKDQNLSKHFKTKLISEEKLKEAYEKGHGTVENKSYSRKLNEMGILTSIEWIPDYQNRKI